MNPILLRRTRKVKFWIRNPNNGEFSKPKSTCCVWRERRTTPALPRARLRILLPSEARRQKTAASNLPREAVAHSANGGAIMRLALAKHSGATRRPRTNKAPCQNHCSEQWSPCRSAVKIYWSGLRCPAGVRRKTFLERFQMAMARGCCAVKVSLSGRRCPAPDKR